MKLTYKFGLIAYAVAAAAIFTHKIFTEASRGLFRHADEPFLYLFYVVATAAETIYGPILALGFLALLAAAFNFRLQQVYRAGPIFMLAPIIVWATAWFFILNEERGALYIVWPLEGAAILAVLWHVALVFSEKGRRLLYLAYAAVFLPILYVILTVALIYATRFPL